MAEWEHFWPNLDDQGRLARRTLPDGRIVGITPLLFGAVEVNISLPESFEQGFKDDTWTYHSLGCAVLGVRDWNGEGEPEGWYRHPRTGRRRPGGRKEREYVEP